MNQDVAALAKKTLEYTQLSPAQVQARKWEIMLFVGTIYASATPVGVARSKKDILERWPKELAAAGGDFALLDPYWHVRVDDGRPPALQPALESALDNPARTLSARLAALRTVAPEERGPLTDLVRALSADAFAGATGEAKSKYVDAMRAVSKTWMQDPWLTILPRGSEGPALQILLDDQGVGANDGSVYDKNAADDPLWSKAIREWDVAFLRDNPLAQAFTAVADGSAAVADAGVGLLGGGVKAAEAVATLIRWAPWVLGGMAVAGVATVATVAVVRAVR